MLVFEMQDDEPPEVEVDTPVSCALSLSDGQTAILVGSSHIRETVGGLSLRISPGSFFQVNTVQAEKLIDIVRDYLRPAEDSVLLDAYCGVGTFGLALAPQVAEVIGIEESSSAIADARINAEGLDQVSFFEGRVEQVLPDLEAPLDLVILDPPRSGCRPDVLRALLERSPLRIAYVSCDPATLARDLRVLIDGGYELQEVQPVDMFPQTAHIEAVALLTRAHSG
jgi:23S rRNA (uracil1939-C5)-methyltransferase